MKSIRVCVVLGVLALSSALVAQSSPSPEALLKAAINREVVDGDPKAAIELYKRVVAAGNRALAAQALLRMAGCYEKLGDAEAQKIYSQIIEDYSDQAPTAAAARARLRSGMPRMICEECADMLGSISPDGRFLATTKAYAGGDRAGDIGLLELSTRALTPLRIEGSGLEATGLAMAPVFSADGRQIVYAWLSQSGNGLRIIPREPSGKVRVLQSAGAPPSVLLPLAWSASGLILALSQESDRRVALVTVAAADGAVRSLKTLGFRVSPGPHIASASPDGRFVAYEQFVTDPPAFVNLRNGAALDRQIHVIAADGSSDVPITTGAGVKRWATWTPTGSHVLYVSNVAGAWDLWATPIRDGRPAGEALLVRKNVGDVTSLGVSAAGAYHFYERRVGVLRTALIPAAGSASSTAGVADSLIGTGPVWSPNGKAIAVGRPDAVVVRIIATGEERVFARAGVATLPFMWFPDGTALLVQVRESATAQSWYRLELASGEFGKLVQEKGDPGFWTHQNVRTLSPDGHTLYYGTCANQACLELDRITALDLATGTYRDVVRLPAANGGLPKTEQDFAVAASPDGLFLALMHRDPQLNATRLAVVGVDGLGYRQLLPPMQATNLRNKLVWSRDGRFIYFTTKVGSLGGDLHRVMRVALSGGAPEPAGLEADRLESFDVSPDGTHLAFSTQRAEGAGELLWSLDVSWLTKGIRQAEIVK